MRPGREGERLRIAGKASDLSWLLPLVGFLLFMPPLLGLFDERRYLFGLPILLIYLFAIWLIGILLTAVSARRLQGPKAVDKGQD